MATVSSHVLDSVIGTHAVGIRVQCFLRDAKGTTTLLFDTTANEQGRIAETVEMDKHAQDVQYELVFHASAYFASKQTLNNTDPTDEHQILKTIVLRLDLPDAHGNYHLPIMLSPHSYSVWWSQNPPMESE